MTGDALSLTEWSEVDHLLREPRFHMCDLTVFSTHWFVAGRAEGDYQELFESLHGPPMQSVVIPGHDGSYDQQTGQRMPHGYPGFAAWKKELVESCGISPENVHACVVRPEKEKVTHTREETDGFVLRAQELGWKSVYVLAHPHQMMRLMCCLLKSQEELKYRLLSVPVFPISTNWDLPVYGSLGAVKKPRWQHALEEFSRLQQYIEKGWCVPLRRLKRYLSDPNELYV